MAPASPDGKLVRDHIPAIIRAQGGVVHTCIVEGEDLTRALLRKLIEEAEEVFDAFEHQPDHVPEELADVLTVVDELCQQLQINRSKLGELITQKRAEKGGFNKGIILLGVPRS